MVARNILGSCFALAAAFGGVSALAAEPCAQPRFTGKAPPEYYDRVSPLAADADISEAERRFAGNGRGVSCATCHGTKGDGKGELASQFDPPPRDFACAQTIAGVPDGQLFWIIRFGSPGTSMPAHRTLTDEQVWKMVAYVRRLAR